MTVELRKALSEVARLDRKLPIGTVAEEEFSELLKELCKIRRHKGDYEALKEEAVDALVGIYTMLFALGVPDFDIERWMIVKCKRTIERYEQKGEM